MQTCRKNILIVESDENLCKILREILGTDFHLKKDLESALNVLLEESFDLVLLNLMLPDSGGVYTLKKLKAKFLDIPVVVINGPDDQELLNRSLQAGAEDYLKRGEVGSRTLLAAISKAQQRSKGRAELVENVANQEYAMRIAALADLANDVAGNISEPIDELKTNLRSIKQEIESEQMGRDVLLQMLAAAQQAYHQLKDVIQDLQEFSEEMYKNPEVKDLPKKIYRILVVDDEPEIAHLLVQKLKRLGHEWVDTAVNGQDAYNKCTRSIVYGPKYDAVIADWRMPKLDGLELLEKLRENPFFQNVAFMMVTAVDDYAKVAQAVERKVSQYLVKPFGSAEFESKVTRLLYQVRVV